MHLSPTFLREAKSRARREGLQPPHGRLYVTDYVAIVPTSRRAREPPFDAAICPFASQGQRGRRGDLAVLQAVRRLPRPGRVYVLETQDRDWLVRRFKPTGESRPDSRNHLVEQRRLAPDGSHEVAGWAFHHHAPSGRCRRVLETTIRVRLCSDGELRRPFEAAGWHVRATYGDVSTLAERSRSTRRRTLVAERPVSQT